MGFDEQELRARLRQAADDARPPRERLWERTTRRIAQRHRRRRAASVASGVAVVALLLAGLPALLEPTDEPDVVLEEPDEPEAAEVPDDERAPDARTDGDPEEVEAEPDEVAPAPAVDVPEGWRDVLLEDAAISIPADWAVIDYEAAAADDPDRACPAGEPVLIVARDVQPSGCPPEEAHLSQGIVVAPDTVAHRALGAVAAGGEPVALPEASGRGLPVGGSPLMTVGADEAERDLLALPGVGGGLLVEVVGGDGVVSAMVEGEDLDDSDADVDAVARTVRLALATLRPLDEVDTDALSVGRHKEEMLSIDGRGESRRWTGLPGPPQALSVPDRATAAERVAAVHTGPDPGELLVVAAAGDEEPRIAYRDEIGTAQPDHPVASRVTIEPVWADGRAHVAWLQPVGAEVKLRLVGWDSWPAVLAGEEPTDDLTATVTGVDADLTGEDDRPLALAPVDWHEQADGQTTLEVGLRQPPEGFTQQDRWVVALPFEDGSVDLTPSIELRPVDH